MKDINNGYGEFEDQDGYKRKFDLSDVNARADMVLARNFAYDHYCLNDGVVTVGGGKIGDKLYFTIAFCAPSDNFSRRVGRAIVQENFVNEDRSHRRAVVDIFKVKKESPSIVLAYALMAYLQRGKCVPQWARNGVVSFRHDRPGLEHVCLHARDFESPEELAWRAYSNHIAACGTKAC